MQWLACDAIEWRPSESAKLPAALTMETYARAGKGKRTVMEQYLNTINLQKKTAIYTRLEDQGSC